jgi:hypothetical protein
MKKLVIAFIRELRAANKLSTWGAAAVKQAVVMRLLSHLGWDVFNVEEVSPDHPAEAATVAFGLKIEGDCRVLLDVAPGGGRPAEEPSPALASAPGEAAELAVDTDGRRFRFFLTGIPGGWPQRHCLTVDLVENKPEHAAAVLIDLLSRERVAAGGHLETARSAHAQKARQAALRALPEAWNLLLETPDARVVAALNEKVETICGCQADVQAIETFLRTHRHGWRLQAAVEPAAAAPPAAPPAPSGAAGERLRRAESLADRPIRSFSLRGRMFPVGSWDEMLPALCNHLAAAHAPEFEKVLWMYDDHRQCFSRYADQLKIPEKIRRTNIYVETKLAPDEVLKTAGDLLTEFGYAHEELVITTQ